MTSLKSSVTAPFRSEGDGDEVPLKIQGDTGMFADTNIHLLLTPNVDATLAVNKNESGQDVGRVTRGASKVIDVPGGIISFSDSDSARLEYVPSVNPIFSTLFAFDSEGVAVPASVFYDAPSKTVRASRKFTGAVSFSAYKTTALMLTYEPLIDNFGTTYGVIAAYYEGALVIYEVDPVNIENGNAVVELYAITSQSVTTRDGEFEKPPDYPSSLAYPDSALELDSSLVALNERVHEAGFINERGFCWVESKNVVIREPYVGDGDYKPTKSKRVASLDPGKYPPDIISKAADFIASRGLGDINA